jgi:hypothetical protein
LEAGFWNLCFSLGAVRTECVGLCFFEGARTDERHSDFVHKTAVVGPAFNLSRFNHHQLSMMRTVPFLFKKPVSLDAQKLNQNPATINSFTFLMQIFHISSHGHKICNKLREDVDTFQLNQTHQYKKQLKPWRFHALRLKNCK